MKWLQQQRHQRHQRHQKQKQRHYAKTRSLSCQLRCQSSYWPSPYDAKFRPGVNRFSIIPKCRKQLSGHMTPQTHRPQNGGMGGTWWRLWRQHEKNNNPHLYIRPNITPQVSVSPQSNVPVQKAEANFRQKK